MSYKNGFTLMEIIVAMVILGTLAAIAVPSYLGLMQQGGAGAVKNNLETIYYAQKNYYLNNGGYYLSPVNSFNDLAGINTGLSLNVQDTSYNYYCSTPTGSIVLRVNACQGSNADIASLNYLVATDANGYYCQATPVAANNSTCIMVVLSDLPISSTGSNNPICAGSYCPS